MSKSMMLRTKFNIILYINPEHLLVIKPDKKYPNMSHIKTKGDNWFHLKQSDTEVLDEYYKCKAQGSKV